MSKVILHFGGNKTGSTALQAALLRNREVLASAGIAYPDFSPLFPTKPKQHWPFTLGFQSHPERYYLMKAHQYTQRQIDELVTGARDMVVDAARSHPVTILSAEAFANLESHEMKKLYAWLDQAFSSVEVIYYARPPGMQKFYSMFQQFVKSGHAPSAPETLKHRVFDQMYQAKKISAEFPRVAFRIYSEEHLSRGDIVEDFLSRIDSPLPRNIWSSSSRINASLSLWATALIFFLNRSGVFPPDELSSLRQQIVKLDRECGETVSDKTEFPTSWHAELVLHEFDGWLDYLRKAQRSDLAKKLQLELPELQELAQEGNFLGNPLAFVDWLAERLPERAWLSTNISLSVADAVHAR